MIASWRGLAVAAALALALSIVVAVDLGRAPVITDRALVPGFEPDRVTELIWQRTGLPAIHVVRSADGWATRTPSLTDPATQSEVPVDPSAIGDVLAALRGARWHRMSETVPVHATLVIASGARRRTIGIGDAIAGAEQAWLVDDGRGLVVDRWVARALDRDLLALRIKAPLAGIRSARTVTIEDSDHERGGHEHGGRVELRITGKPRQLAAPDRLLIAADIASELERALGEIAVVRIPDAPGAAHGLAITTAGDDPPRDARAVVSLVLGGNCPGAPELVALSGTLGDGCVEPAAVAAVDRALGRLEQPLPAIVERRPIPFEPARVVLADGVALDITALRVGDAPADQARVAELLAALAAPAEVTTGSAPRAEVAGVPAGPAISHLVATGRDGTAVTLDLVTGLVTGHVLVRHGEPIALRPAPGAWRLLVRPSRELRDLTLWIEEPTTIISVQIDDARYVRGAVIGDWVRQPAAGASATARATPRATVDAATLATLDALVARLAAPRALGLFDDQVAISHRVILTIAPPAGPPTEHVLAIGLPRGAGCPARIARETFVLPAIVCTQVAALAN